MPNFKFPDADETSPKNPTVLCPASRVLDLYNQDSGDSAKRISKKVREWFFEEAHNQGWDGVHFIPDVQSKHGAGCVMWRTYDNAPMVQMTATTIFLEDSDK